LLVLGGLLLRVYSANDPFLNPWDERFHALVAKNMIGNPFKPVLYQTPVLPYTPEDWSANHIWLHKQPFALWLMSLSMKVFGVNLWALRLPSIMISTIGIGVMYKLGERLYHQRIGYISAFLWAIHGMLIELGGGRRATDHVDAIFISLILIGAYFALRSAQERQLKFSLVTGLIVGVAVLTKWLPALIILPVWGLWAIHFRQYRLKSWLVNGSIMFLMALIVFMPWQVYTHLTFPIEASWEQYYNYLHLFEGLEGHDQPWYFHLDNIRILFGELIYLPLIWWVWQNFGNRKNIGRWAITVWLLLPLAFFTFAATKMPAYILISAPAVFLITAMAWDTLMKFRYRLAQWQWVLSVFALSLIVLPVRYSLERIKPFDRDMEHYKKRAEVNALKGYETKAAPLVIFNAPNPIETMFFIEATVYGYVPEDYVVDSLRTAKNKVVVLPE
ncbi:MAG: glycosyltransferase family 39 protein, partial [Phaeodactylibacter sp.]|nr:glycosyltransferase family 39 protein [Phaeodactylibacter sp.]